MLSVIDQPGKGRVRFTRYSFPVTKMDKALLKKLLAKGSSLPTDLPPEGREFFAELLERAAQALQNELFGEWAVGPATHTELYFQSHPRLNHHLRGLSDLGWGRQKNQDACSGFLIPDPQGPNILCLVADGLGCYLNSERAASRAVIEIPRLLHGGMDLVQACRKLHRELCEHLPYREQVLRAVPGPGLDSGATTLVSALIQKDRLTISNIGDSRGYVIRDATVIYRTRDQSVRELLRAEGKLDEDAIQAHPLHRMIMNAIGSPEKQFLFPDAGRIMTHETGLPLEDSMTLQPGDYVLLATDGLYSNLTEADLITLITKTAWDGLIDKVHDTMQALIKAGVSANPDNYTFLLYRH